MSSETASWPEHREDARSRTIVLARHGETALNVEKRFRGRADPPLTPRGVEQAGRLGEALVGFEPSLLLSSPRERALRTAGAVAACAGLDLTVEPRLEDIDYGEWTGLTHGEVAGRWPEHYRNYRQTLERAEFPGGESVPGMVARIESLVSELVRSDEGGVAVLITHDIVIRTLVCRVLTAPLAAMHRLRIDVASTTGMSAENGRIAIDWVNDVSHLRQGAALRVELNGGSRA